MTKRQAEESPSYGSQQNILYNLQRTLRLQSLTTVSPSPLSFVSFPPAIHTRAILHKLKSALLAQKTAAAAALLPQRIYDDSESK